MFDGLFELISSLLNFFYQLVPNYAVAIALLTGVVMLVTTPLTLKGTRSMIEMQRLQPEIRRLQVQYKDDRQKLNEELMKFYKEHEINPVGSCLPLLIQAPVFSILFWVVRGLTNQSKFVGLQRNLADYGIEPTVTQGFRPKYLDHDADLYNSLLGREEMTSFGIDLAKGASDVLSESFVSALPYLGIVAVIAVLSWYQQKQIMGRNPSQEMTQQQRMMMRIGPLMYVFFAFIMPAAIGVYFLVSTVWRVAQQGYITRSLYRGDDSIGVQAQKAMAELRESRKDDKPGGGARKAEQTPAAGKKATKGAVSGNGAGSSPARGSRATAGSAVSSSGAKPHPRSRKKKKRK
jgi:YidC/Oxa1 family membrane protein insertase